MLVDTNVLIFVVTYNAQSTIESLLARIPAEVLDNDRYRAQVLVIDDCSADATFRLSEQFLAARPGFPLRVLRNPVNLGYGGNQKVGYHYAIREGFDAVALLHGDGQYAPEKLPELLQPLLDGEADAVFGTRMHDRRSALAGGMPLYKLAGNIVLTRLQNALVGTHLSEYHSGYRLYSTAALKQVPFEKNSNGFDFDTDIIIQFHLAGLKIVEIPIPTFYGDEICYVNGLQYARRILGTSLRSRLQRAAIFYEPKFDLARENEHYEPKFDFTSSHSLALAALPEGASVLNFGCGGAELVRPFAAKSRSMDAVDYFIGPELRRLENVRGFECDLDKFDFSRLDGNTYDVVLLLDIIEHLGDPEWFLDNLRRHPACEKALFIVTTPNIAFATMRLTLLAGSFNYGKRGILDRTHRRLFTFNSLMRIFVEQGYRVEKLQGIPAPFPLAVGRGRLGNALLAVNRALIGLSKRLFAFQICAVVRPLPTVESLLAQAEAHARDLQQNPEGN